MYLSLVVVVTAIVGFTSLTEAEKNEATNIGIKPYSWDQFLDMVGLYGFSHLIYLIILSTFYI